LATPAPPTLGPESRPGVLSVAALNAKLDGLFSAANFPSNQQQLIRALLLLWHDHLDASHEISQGIENADGSLIHAIMHRREPDYWNAKYWWRRVGIHPVFPEIARRTGEFLQQHNSAALMAKLLPNDNWDAAAFVDACEAAASSASTWSCSAKFSELRRRFCWNNFYPDEFTHPPSRKTPRLFALSAPLR
jgi:hypothetical protein